MQRTKECRELAGRVRNQILFEPTSHHQPTWALMVKKVADKLGVETDRGLEVSQCNTTGCVCGWASMIAGDKALISREDDVKDYFPLNGKNQSVYSISRVRTPDGKEVPVWTRGAALLCLSEPERSWLFDAFRSRHQVLNALAEIERGEELSYTGSFSTAEQGALERPTHKDRKIVYYRQEGEERVTVEVEPEVVAARAKE